MINMQQKCLVRFDVLVNNEMFPFFFFLGMFSDSYLLHLN